MEQNYQMLMTSVLDGQRQVWFQNRRAKFRKQERTTDGGQSNGKTNGGCGDGLDETDSEEEISNNKKSADSRKFRANNCDSKGTSSASTTSAAAAVSTTTTTTTSKQLFWMIGIGVDFTGAPRGSSIRREILGTRRKIQRNIKKQI